MDYNNEYVYLHEVTYLVNGDIACEDDEDIIWLEYLDAYSHEDEVEYCDYSGECFLKEDCTYLYEYTDGEHNGYVYTKELDNWAKETKELDNWAKEHEFEHEFEKEVA